MLHLFSCFSIIIFVCNIVAFGDTTKTYRTPDGTFSFSYPTTWYLNSQFEDHVTLYNVAPDQILTSDQGLMLNIVFPVNVSEFEESIGGSKPVEIVLSSIAISKGIEAVLEGDDPLSQEEIQEILGTHIIEFEVGDYPAARAIYSITTLGATTKNMFVAIDLGDEMIMTVVATTIRGNLDSFEETILEIVDTIRYQPLTAQVTSEPTSTTVSPKQTPTKQ